MANSVTTAGGLTLDIRQLANAETAVRSIALNNQRTLSVLYRTNAQDVNALVELAHQKWYELSKEGETDGYTRNDNGA